MSPSTVCRIEHGHLASYSFRTADRIAATLGIRLDIVPRWRGGELDRLLNSGHSAMHEVVARRLGAMPGWRFAPEVSFSFYGERGVIDVLAWHEARRMLLVIELKTASWTYRICSPRWTDEDGSQRESEGSVAGPRSGRP